MKKPRRRKAQHRRRKNHPSTHLFLLLDERV